MKVFVVTCALLSVAFAHTVPTGEPSILQECFDQDSIACVQQTVRTTFKSKFQFSNIIWAIPSVSSLSDWTKTKSDNRQINIGLLTSASDLSLKAQIGLNID